MTSKDHVRLIWSGYTVYVDPDASRVWMGGDYTEVTSMIASDVMTILVRRARQKRERESSFRKPGAGAIVQG